MEESYMAFNLSLEQVKSLLANAGYIVLEEKRLGNNLATTLKL